MDFGGTADRKGKVNTVKKNMDKRLWLIRHATVRPVLPV